MINGSGLTEDVLDYYAALKECGLTHELVYKQTMDEEDCIPFPHGSYPCQTGQSTIDGRGVFATANLLECDIIAPAILKGKRTPAARYLNHSKHPNCKFTMDPKEDIYLIAITNIQGCKGGQLGDELTVDYRNALSVSKGDIL